MLSQLLGRYALDEIPEVVGKATLQADQIGSLFQLIVSALTPDEVRRFELAHGGIIDELQNLLCLSDLILEG
jgi:hypothetical protein